MEFAVAQLVEVALRALSPAVNDTFTALVCIDRMARVRMFAALPSTQEILYGPTGEPSSQIRRLADSEHATVVIDSLTPVSAFLLGVSHGDAPHLHTLWKIRAESRSA